MLKILSIDGGGIRGIIPAMVLAEIEKRTRKPVAELFQLIAGTSTGGILTLGLTKPGSNGKPQYSAAEMIDLYEKEGKVIFSRSFLHRLLALGFILREKYPARGIETILQKYFGNTRLKEALTEVLITAYDTEGRDSWFFKSSEAVDEAGTDFFMRDVARATSAAPTYFAPAKVQTAALVDYYSLIDGGVFANNPAMCAYVEAIASRRGVKEDILVVSLGTGELTRPLPYIKIKHWGARWAQPILDIVFDGVSDTVDYQLRQLLPPAKDGSGRYYRFQVRLERDNDQMDTTAHGQIHLYKLLAEKLVQERGRDLDELCKLLVRNPLSRDNIANRQRVESIKNIRLGT
ncbi:MAG TPA: patatin [Firmicutes bacterium]|nr:patatin [Bacillota bacterium]